MTFPSWGDMDTRSSGLFLSLRSQKGLVSKRITLIRRFRQLEHEYTADLVHTVVFWYNALHKVEHTVVGELVKQIISEHYSQR